MQQIPSEANMGGVQKGAERMSQISGVEGFPERLRSVVGSESVRSFARRSRVSEATLRNYLEGERLPSLDRAARLAAAAGVSLGWLVSGEGQARKGAPGAVGAAAGGFSPEDVEGIVLIVEQHEGAQGSSPEKKAAYVRALLEWELSRRSERGLGDGSSSGAVGPGDD